MNPTSHRSPLFRGETLKNARSDFVTKWEFRQRKSRNVSWRAAILVDGYPVWSRGFATKEASSLRDELQKRPQPALRCLECPNDEVVVGQKSADGAKIQRWFECRECGYESRSAIVYGPER